ncbi:MAG: carboxypeptidase regulatory-like domain-containing protein, partial [Acidobacteriota bacterium]|nr:carboxypeptidase regulatory-like domain-containing protein [Acidobacteriota bacterium]
MLAFPALAAAAQYYGQVFFGAVPVPGATVTVTQGAKRFTTVTDQQGLYQFADLADGAWKIEITMRGFATIKAQVTVAPSAPQGKWDLKLLALDQLLAESQVTKPLEARPAAEEQSPSKQEAAQPGATHVPEAPPQTSESDAEKAADGLLINGSMNNADTSPFSLSPAFGNRRPGSRGLYNGSIGAISGNSIFDARPYSLTGQQTPKGAYNRITTLVTLGGPLKIPHLLPRGPNFFVAYQWTRYANAANQTGLVPDAAERSGDLSGLTNPMGQPLTIYNPATGQPFTGPIPVSPQAQSLLNLFPLPNIPGNTFYNYETEVLS